MTMDLLITRMRQDEIDLMPDFQRRDDIWGEAAQSRLIESLLIRIPLPAFYMDATNEDCWLVVDGLQRLSTLKRFVIEKNLKLTGLEFLTQLEAKGYDDLPRTFRRRIDETQVTIYLIEKGTPPGVKFNIFKRINTGGAPLTAQEIRHALNQGAATRLLARLADSDAFKSATDRGVNPKRMDDRECVLRFLAFVITPYTEYPVKKDFDSFLSDKMAEINAMNDVEQQRLEQRFKRAMIAANVIFGDEAFRKKYSPDAPRFPINKAIFESWSVNLDSLAEEDLVRIVSRKSQVVEGFMKLMHNRDFEAAVSSGTGDVKKVQKRFESIGNLLAEVMR
ncbi:MAG: DUF262 domain-containing protein [Syntrophobacteraceae bacterium]|nr:DUF262 domain-containing protein [Syntrophobacteraceae bacterium]